MSSTLEGVRVVRAEASEDQEQARAIRRVVFVLEQGVPAHVEVDGKDVEASHFLARIGACAVAAARLRRTAHGYKLERVAVLREFRGQRVGEALVRHLVTVPPPGSVIYAHAQYEALGFWQRLGFVAEGPTFIEGGIQHRYITLRSPG
jgi:predicted GNAT family N-acyltransferase